MTPTPRQLAHLEQQGWEINQFYVELHIEELYLDIEFCIGDFCVGLFSSDGRWLLEDKKRCHSWEEAMLVVEHYITRLKNGEEWKGDERSDPLVPYTEDEKQKLWNSLSRVVRD